MNRFTRAFRIWMLFTLVLGSFSQLEPQPLIAADDTVGEPTVEVQPGTAGDPVHEIGSPDEEVAGEPETPYPVDVIAVTPEAPVVAECGDISAIQLPVAPEGVDYTVVDLGDGAYVVEARIVDSASFEWGELTDPWLLEDETARYLVSLEPCIEEAPGTEEAVPGDSDSISQPNSMGPANESLNLSLAVETELDDRYSVEIYEYRVHITLNDDNVNYQFTMTWSEGQEFNSWAIPFGVYDSACVVHEATRSMTCGIDSGVWLTGENETHTWILSLRETTVVQDHCALSVSFQGSAAQAGTDATWNQNNTASATAPTGQQCGPDLSIELSPETLTVAQDQLFDLTMTIHNNGAAIDGVDATFAVPGWTHIENRFILESENTNCPTHGVQLDCSNLSIPESGSLTIPIEVTPYGRAATCGTYPLTASLSDESVPSATSQLTIECDVDYDWTQSISTASATTGDEVTYTYVFENTGNTAFALDIQDALPEMPASSPWQVSVNPTLFSSTTCLGEDQTFFTTTSSIDCQIYNAVPDASVTITATATIPQVAGPDAEICGEFESSATAAIDPLRVTSPDGGLEVITELRETDVAPTGESTLEVLCPGIEVEISNDVVDGSTIKPREEIAYTVEVRNTGTLLIDDYSISIDLDAGLTLDQLTFESVLDACEATTDVLIECGVSEFETNTAHTFVFTATVNNDLTAEQCNSGIESSVSLTSTGISEATQPITDSSTAAVECVTDVEVELLAEESTVVPGEIIAYTLNVTNNGNLILNDVEIALSALDLPGDGTWYATIDGNTVSMPYTFDQFNPDDSVSIRIESSEIPDDLTLPGTEWCRYWTTTANVTGMFSNGNEADERDTTSVRVNCTGLAFDMQVSDEVVGVGETVNFSITLTNYGNTVVQGVVVEYDIADAGVVFGNWKTTSGACVIDDVISCEFDELERFDSVTIEFTAVAPMIPTLEQCAPVDHLATFTYQSADEPTISQAPIGITPPNTIVESNTVSTQIDCQPSMELSSTSDLITGEDGRMDAGDTVNVSATVTNTGNMTIYDVTVSDSGDVIDWGQSGGLISELNPGDSAELTGVYVVTQADLDNGEISNTLSATGSLEPVSADGSASADHTFIHGFGMAAMQAPVLNEVTAETDVVILLEQVASIDFEVSVTSSDPTTVGDVVTYTFFMTNSGNVTLNEVVIESSIEGLVWDSQPVIGSLAPGSPATVTATYVVTEEDVAAAELVNSAQVAGVAVNEEAVTASDSITLEIAEPVEPEPTPTSPPDPIATPGVSPTPEKETEPVTELPSTGSGSSPILLPVLWVAATLGVLALGVRFGVGNRRRI